MKLKRIDPLSTAKVIGLIYVIIGFIAGIFISIGSYAWTGSSYAWTGSYMMGMMSPQTGLGLLSIIVFPIIYGIGGFIMGAIIAWLYNIVESWIGGIEVTLK